MLLFGGFWKLLINKPNTENNSFWFHETVSNNYLIMQNIGSY